MRSLVTLVLFIFYVPLLLAQSCETNSKVLVDTIDQLIHKKPQIAINQLKQVLKNCLEEKDSFATVLGDLYHKIGYASYYSAQDKQADFFLSLAIKVKTQKYGLYHESTARSFYLRAETNFYLENYPKAIGDNELAIAIIEKINHPKKDSLLARCHVSLAKIYKEKGDFYKALDFHTKSSKILSYTKDGNIALNFYIEKGQIYIKLKKYQLAKENYEYVKNLWQKNPKKYDLRLYRVALNDLGLAFIKEGKSNLAIPIYEEALSNNLPTLKSDTIGTISLYSNLVNAYVETNQFEKLENTSKKGLELANYYYKNQYQNQFSDFLNHKAIADRKQKKYNDALNYHQKAIQILVPSFTKSYFNNPILTKQPTGDKTRLKKVLYLKAQTLQQKYQDETQIEDLKAALDTYITIDTLITQTRQSFQTVASKYFLQEEIIPIYEQGIKVALQLSDLYPDDIVYKEIAFQLIARNKAIILIEGLQNEKGKLAAGIEPTLLAREENLKKQYYQLETTIYEANQNEQDTLVQILRDSLFEVKRVYDDLITTLEKEYPKYYQYKHAYYANQTSKSIQQQLDKNQAIIEFFVGIDSIYIAAISQKKFLIKKVSKANDFEADCVRYINMTRGINLQADTFSKLGHQLYMDLLSSVLKELNDVTRITLIPDDILLQLPWDNLLTKKHIITSETWHEPSIPYLIKEYALSQEFASSLLFKEQDSQRIQQATKNFGGFGIEFYDYVEDDKLLPKDSLIQRGIGRLPYSAAEVREVHQLLGGDTLINQLATKEFLLANVHKYKILHFATHGFANEVAPQQSTLVLAKSADSSDYFLRASDIYSLPINAQLVTLSACQTFAGTIQKGEGIRTIARAFAYAGSPSMVASLWNIPDESTKIILTDFYKYLKQGYSKDLALQQAKKDYLMNQDDAKDFLPNRWSQVVLIGETEAIFSHSCYYWLLIPLGIVLLYLIFRRNRNY